MGQKMKDSNRFSQVALIARARALTATPPAPSIGDSILAPPLPEWLAGITPLGADVLHTNQSVLPLTAPKWTTVEPASRMTTRKGRDGGLIHESRGSPEAYQPGRLPSQAPRTSQRLREERVADAWSRAHALCLALKELGIGPRGVGRRSLALAETALWLAGPLTRDPGVPIYAELPLGVSAHLSTRHETQLRGKRWGRNGANVLRIECAASHDLVAAPFAQLSRVQGWSDHEDHAGRPGNSSSAKRAVREGRTLLHSLGAWPWAHAERGRLHEHDEWWSAPNFLAPLRTWIAQSWGRFLISEVGRQRHAAQLEPKAGPEGIVGEASLKSLEWLAADLAVALDADRLLDFIKASPEDQQTEDVTG